ncbi:ABC transporter permease [uncultured Sphingomonas sp.]|uniref:ABC transporter permease n=1 Tax=uncultured Sphingomonas sp. TaxID=158754 RepID=UPI0025D1CE94|nr:ABC transporter permease [uncultured Sphingomonas sp.]
MIAMLHVEIRKLNGSLALLLAVLAPALPGLLAVLSLISTDRAPQWGSIFTGFVLPIWSFFLLPMVVAAFTALVGQIEYRARGWDHLLALPIARWRLFLAKAIVVLAVSAMMTMLVLLFTWVGVSIGGAISGQAPLGTLPWAKLGHTVSLLLAGTTMLIVIQLWVALRFASFVMPLVVGIGGTLVAMSVAMTRTDQAGWFPWVLPLKILTAPDPVRHAILGGIGGLILLIIMICDLSRHDFR